VNPSGRSSRPAFGHAAQSYRQTAVQTAGPARLIVEVHDAALTSVLQRASHAASELALVRAHALVSELQSALRTEVGGGLARELHAFYDEVLHQIVDAYVQQSTGSLQHVADALRELRGAWSSLCDRSVRPPPV
jgi:flagellar biosynthetic protein FliS